MSAHRLLFDLFLDGAPHKIPDPGDAGTFTVDRQFAVCELVSAAAETRTLGDPKFAGQYLLLQMKTDAGDITITASSPVDQAGTTSIVFSDTGDMILLIGVEDGAANFEWRVVGADGVAGIGYLPLTGGTVTGDVTLDTADLILGDNDDLVFGDGNDRQMNWNGTYLEMNPASGMWTNAPSPADPQYHVIAHEHFDDFNKPASATASDVHAYTSNDDGATGTNAFQDAAAGIYNVVTAAADNDYHAMSSVAESWLFASGKEMWFEVRFKLAEATTNESAWWFGFTDTLTTGGFQANAAGPLASYDGALIWKDEGTLEIDFETSNAGTQNTTSNMATFVSDTFTTVGFYFDGTATTSVVTPYVDGTAGTAQNITLAGLEQMHLVFGVKAGPTAAAETLQVDYIKVVQLR